MLVDDILVLLLLLLGDAGVADVDKSLSGVSLFLGRPLFLGTLLSGELVSLEALLLDLPVTGFTWKSGWLWGWDLEGEVCGARGCISSVLSHSGELGRLFDLLVGARGVPTV